MHEYSVAASLLDLVEKRARHECARKVLGVELKLGELSGVESDLLLSAWQLVRDGTICSHAPLEIRQVKVRWACPQCGEAMRRGSLLSCAGCGTPARLVEGAELVLERIEMEIP